MEYLQLLIVTQEVVAGWTIGGACACVCRARTCAMLLMLQHRAACSMASCLTSRSCCSWASQNTLLGEGGREEAGCENSPRGRLAMPPAISIARRIQDILDKLHDHISLWRA